MQMIVKKKLSVRTLQVYIRTLKDARQRILNPDNWLQYINWLPRGACCAVGACGVSYRYWKKKQVAEDGFPNDDLAENLGVKMLMPGAKIMEKENIRLADPELPLPIRVNDGPYTRHEDVIKMFDLSIKHWQRRLKKALKARKVVMA